MDIVKAQYAANLFRDQKAILGLLEIAKEGKINSYFYPETEIGKKTIEDAISSAAKTIQEEIEKIN